MKKSSKHENDWFLMYIVFYMIVRNYRFWGSILEFIASVISKILPDWMQTRKFKDAKFRHDVVSNDHDWGLNVSFATYNMTGAIILLFLPLIAWNSKWVEQFGINPSISDAIQIFGIFFSQTIFARLSL